VGREECFRKGTAVFGGGLERGLERGEENLHVDMKHASRSKGEQERERRWVFECLRESFVVVLFVFPLFVLTRSN